MVVEASVAVAASEVVVEASEVTEVAVSIFVHFPSFSKAFSMVLISPYHYNIYK